MSEGAPSLDAHIGNYTPSRVRDAGRGKVIRKSNQIEEEGAKTRNK